MESKHKEIEKKCATRKFMHPLSTYSPLILLLDWYCFCRSCRSPSHVKSSDLVLFKSIVAAVFEKAGQVAVTIFPVTWQEADGRT